MQFMQDNNSPTHVYLCSTKYTAKKKISQCKWGGRAPGPGLAPWRPKNESKSEKFQHQGSATSSLAAGGKMSKNQERVRQTESEGTMEREKE
jgi:hypothetical protein